MSFASSNAVELQVTSLESLHTGDEQQLSDQAPTGGVVAMDQHELRVIRRPHSGSHLSDGEAEAEEIEGDGDGSDSERGLVGDVQEALDTRPSIMLGRALSIRRTKSAYAPKRPVSADPAASKRVGVRFQVDDERPQGQRVRLRRRSSFPGADWLEKQTAIDLNDLLLEQAPQDILRRTTMRLKERIEEQREIQPLTVRESLWGNFRYVKWPKVKSRLKVLLSYELWKSHLKEVEGNFGTSVVSYFVFLRFLFAMNLLIFVFWFGLVCAPQIAWEVSSSSSRRPSQLACGIVNFSSLSSYNCSDGPPASFAHLITCDDHPVPNATFQLRECGFSKDGIANRESSVVLTASHESPCSGSAEVGGNFTSPDLALCTTGVSPYIVWYEYLIDFFTGQGIFNQTVLFLGHYSNSKTIGSASYSIPLAVITMCGVIFLISMLLLVYKMGHAYNESYVDFGSGRTINFCNKLFTAWDFNITDPATAKLKRAQNKTDFEEELSDYHARSHKRTWKQLLVVVLIRIATNSFTIAMLALSGAAIYYTAAWGLDQQLSGQATGIIASLQSLVLSTVISILNIILPFIFQFLARFERFKTQSGEIKMTLVRAILVRLSSLIVLVISIYSLIQCTQPTDNSSSTSDQCTVASIEINVLDLDLTLGQNRTSTCSITCWETYVGQEFYKLGLTNFVVIAGNTVLVETLQKGNDTMLVVVTEVINSISDCTAQTVLDYFLSAGFALPLITVLALMAYAEYVMLKARKRRFILIQKQLILEGANVSHIVGRLDGVLQKMADHQEQLTKAAKEGEGKRKHVHLPERLRQVKESLSEQEKEELEVLRAKEKRKQSTPF